MTNLHDYFEKLYNENKLSHAFLIGNVSLNSIKYELLDIFNKFILNSKTNVENNPNVYFIEEKNGIIKKESIKELLNKLSTTSQFDSAKIYVIDKCENLSEFSYNSILKTLEEPSDNIYAFLISTNIDSVKPTISSRCQKILISSSYSYEYEDEFIDVTNYIIESIEKNGINAISINSKIYKLIEDKNKLISILKNMFYIYNEELNNLVNDGKIINILLNNNDLNSLMKKILIINNNLNNLKGNLNKNISIDRIIIEMGRCNL